MIYIIGSGLSGVSAAVALARRGYQATILDVGLTPEPAALALKQRLSSTEPEFWKDDDLQQQKQTDSPSVTGIPRKRTFGSDFSYRDIEISWPIHLENASIIRSFAEGGFSNSWGASFLPFREDEISDWPVTIKDLSSHYTAVLSFMCHSVGHDCLTDRYPLYTEFSSALHPSAQARSLLSDLDQYKDELRQKGIQFGQSRLAVRAEDQNGRKGCRYNGLCLFGCPYDCIYTASSTLNWLMEKGKIKYVRNVFVERLSNQNGKVQITTRSLTDGTQKVFTGSLVFVGAGLLSTARIMLDSLGMYDTPLTVKHSDIFTFPFLRYRKTNNVPTEKLHTLSQIFVEIYDKNICRQTTHLQFYGYNELYFKILEDKFRLFGSLLKRPCKEIISRMLVVFGYLHSDISSTMSLSLESNTSKKLKLVGMPNPQALRVSRKIAKKLRRNRKYFKGIPILWQLRLDLPGGGYHSGGTFPMSHNPSLLETDILGRLQHFENVHIIDSSILPDIPSTTMAFSVMANAHRIASECQVPDGN